MLSRCCRVFYRARSRSQRRRLVLWFTALGLLMCLALYNQQSLQVLSQLSHDARHPRDAFQAQPDETVGRQPQALKPEKLAAPVSSDDVDEDKSDLRSDLAPATVHFLWCGKRPFEFRHYMAVKRAEHLIRPDKIFFHYEALPEVDAEGYFLWFNRTLADRDNFLLRPLNSSRCAMEGAERYITVLDLLERFGGIYIPEDAILVDFPVHLRSAAIVTGVQASSPSQFQDGVMAAMKGAFSKPATADELLVVLSKGRQDNGGIQPCGTIEHYNLEEDGDCMCVKVTSNLYPKDILEVATPFATLARVAAYGTPQWRLEHSLKNAIPRIAHYVCIDCEVQFITFLSMRSAVNVAGLNKVYLHGVKEPHGKWWEKLKEDSRFVYVHREYPETLYDRAVLTSQLAIGIMRLSILLKYGGVYCDDRVLWTQRIPDGHFGYSAVASPDWHLYGSWPDSVNHAVLMAKKNAPYLLKLRAVLHKYRLNPYWFNDHFMAYKIVETHPDILFLDRHLQVKCLNHNCHPTWQPNYKSGLQQNRPGGSFSWRNDTLSIHWKDTFPELDPDTVKYTSGMIVDVSRHVLHTSGIVIQELR
ncbi:uncharacterized protein LOC143284085 isoform X2 [Babylonia areolata]